MAGKTPIKLKTETEHLLYKAYSDEKAENENLRQIIQKMQAQIDELQEQVRILSQPRQSEADQATPIETSSQNVEYHTDEEELARETEWIRVKNKRNKKRKMSTSPTQTLSDQSEDTPNTHASLKTKSKKIPPPPPIIVEGVDNYQEFFDYLTSTQPAESFTTKIMSSKCVKINALNVDSYKSLTKILSESDRPWHSYENKQERPIRVMVKNLHHSCKPDRIIDDLLKKGYKIEDAANKLSWKSKEPLNLFMLTFRTDEDINKIYSIKSVLGCKVEIHPIKASRLVPQCKRCQGYGHTQRYCSKEPRCVKCTGKHLTRDCTKPAGEKPKCVHCGQPHPANYRGCLVAKEMQSLKNKNAKKSSGSKDQQVVPQEQRNKPKVTATLGSTQQNQTYARMAANHTKSGNYTVPTPSSNDFEGKLDKILKLMSSFDIRLNKIENGAKDSI